jgi:hypothetical protein
MILKSRSARVPSRKLRRPVSVHLQVETLEDRLTPAVASPSQNFVAQAYLDLLGRQVDPAGLAGWSKLVDSGVSRTQVALDIMSSAEFLTNEQIKPLYGKTLNRAADPGGLAADLSFLQNGGKIEQVIIGILGSPEFFAVHGGTNDSWLDGAYAALQLGNPKLGLGIVDPAGRAGWDAAFAQGVTRQQVAISLVNGLEYEQNTVSSFYSNFLHRPADTTGLDGWVNLDQVAGQLFVLANIIGSPEYFQNAQSNPQTPLPTITGLSPTSGAVGTSVKITGTFLSNTTALTIAGDTIPAASFTIVSAGEIDATIPTGAVAGTGPATVTTPFGPASSASNFTIGPAITGFGPSSGPQGTVVTINGSNFTGATSVTIDGLSASFTVNNNLQISATVPTGGTVGSSGPVTVTTAFGTATSALSFTLSAAGAPSFTPSPASGKAGDVITLNGTNLFGVTSVTFNGVTATIGTDTSTSVQVTVPSSTNGNIVVTTTPGNTGSAFFSYPATVTSFNDTTTGVNPASSAGIGDSITITGTNFLGATGVTFNGTAASFSIVNNTTITTTVPGGATTGAVVVTTGAGTSSPSASLMIVPAPSISTIPATSNEDPTVTINGSGFTGVTTVTFGGTSVAFTVVNDNVIHVNTVDLASVITGKTATGGTFTVTVTRSPGGTGTGSWVLNPDSDGGVNDINDADDFVT